MANKVANMTFSDQQQVKNQNPGHYRQLTEILLLILIKIMSFASASLYNVPQSDLRINALILLTKIYIMIRLRQNHVLDLLFT